MESIGITVVILLMTKAKKGNRNMSKAEEYIIEHTSVLKESNGKEYFKWLTPDQAKEAVDIAREEIYEWLEKNAHKYATIGIYTDAMIIDLKQVIKDK